MQSCRAGGLLERASKFGILLRELEARLGFHLDWACSSAASNERQRLYNNWLVSARRPDERKLIDWQSQSGEELKIENPPSGLR